MDTGALLSDAVGRVGEGVHEVLDGLSDAHLVDRLDGRTNSIAWLVWHIARVQDDHVAGVAETEQRWVADGWAERFALDLPVSDHGYGHTDEQVGLVVAPAATLAGYYDAVEATTKAYVSQLSASDLDEVVDTRWDPPVTLGVRLVSVIDDGARHVGQAAFLRGVLERRDQGS